MIELALCKHCDHFVDANYEIINPGVKLARYIHCEDGEQEFDHDAEPGELHTDQEWWGLRPDLFIQHPDGAIGPNSKFHSQRGKVAIISDELLDEYIKARADRIINDIQNSSSLTEEIESLCRRLFKYEPQTKQQILEALDRWKTEG